MEINIPANKKRIPFVFLGALLLSVLVGVYVFSLKKAQDGMTSIIMFSILLVVFITYAIAAFIDYMKTLFDKKACLVINDKGVYDNLNLFSCGEIEWSEIADVVVINKLGGLLIIRVVDPKKIISREPFWKRYMLHRYMKTSGGIAIISQQRVEYNLNELKDIIMKNRQRGITS